MPGAFRVKSTAEEEEELDKELIRYGSWSIQPKRTFARRMG